MRRPLSEGGAEANGTASSDRCRWTRRARRVVPMWWGGRWEKTLAVFCGHAGDSGGPRLRCQVRGLEDILYGQKLERGCWGFGEQKKGPKLVPGLTPHPLCASPDSSRRNGGGDRLSLAAPCWPASSVCVLVHGQEDEEERNSRSTRSEISAVTPSAPRLGFSLLLSLSLFHPRPRPDPNRQQPHCC